MKKILFLVTIAIIISANCFSQFVYKIKADSLLVTNDSCNAELILENSTRNVDGYLYNKGNGRTEFRSIFNKIDSVTYRFGNDTIKIAPVFTAQNGLQYNSITKTIEFGNDPASSLYYGPANQARNTIYHQDSWLFNWVGGYFGIPTFSKEPYGDFTGEYNPLSYFYITRFAHQSQGALLFEANHKNPTGYAAPTFWFGFKNHHPDAVKYAYFGDSLVASITVGQRSATDGKVYSPIIFKLASDTASADGDILTLVPPFHPYGTGKNGMRIPTTVTPRMSIVKRGSGIPAYDPTPLDDSNPYSRLVIDATGEPLVFANLPAGDGYALVVDSTGKVRKNGSAYVDGAAPKVYPYDSIADNTTVVWDVTAHTNTKVILAGNRTLQIDNAVDGSKGDIIVKQDATGSRKLTLPANSYIEDIYSTGPLLSTDPNSVDILSFRYDGTRYFWKINKTFQLIQPKVKFNFSQTSQVVSGWTNMYGNPGSGLSVTDGNTGWTLITNSGQWGLYFGVYASNADGGSSLSSPTYSDIFPLVAMKGTFINNGMLYSSGQTTYPFHFTNLPAGDYELKIMSSVKSTIVTTGVGHFNAKFGSSANQNATVNMQDNDDTVVTFSGTIGSGEILKFGPFENPSLSPTATVINAIILTKTN